MMNSLRLGTHNGTFHCDEVLACFLLKQLSQYKMCEIVRSRDQSILDKCDIVVDVGGIFNHNLKRYDHHQKTFNETFKSLCPEKPWDIKLSSAGLVYVFYGKQILQEMCSAYKTDIDIDILHHKIYENFILEVDAIDNGVPICNDEPNYVINSNLSSRVGQLNPRWNENKPNETECFYKAMSLVGSEFINCLEFYINSWWPARRYVLDAIETRFDVHPSGKILKMTMAGCPWKKHIYDLEKDMFGSSNESAAGMYQFVYILYPDRDSWRIQCISVTENRPFDNRLSLMSSWCGLRNEELSKESGIPDCVFVHMNGFIGGNKTYDGALQMAVKSLKNGGYLD